jgi:hypothetical protein
MLEKSGHSTYPIGTAPSGRPGWPLLAFCTLPTDRKQIGSTAGRSNGAGLRVVAAAMLIACFFGRRTSNAGIYLLCVRTTT